MRASASASISFSVSGVSGQVSATKSASRQQRRRAPSIGCTASAAPAPAAGSRRRPITRMSNALASLASRPPISPRPTISSVLPPSSSSRLAQIADHAAPDAPRLVVARLRQPAAQRQDQRHRVLGDGAGVDAARARQADAAARQRLARKLVGAGADRLDEAQPGRPIEQPVVPQPRDHQHVGLGQRGCQGLGVAHREAGDAGPERRKALVQPIGDMSKADRQPVYRQAASWSCIASLPRKHRGGNIGIPSPAPVIREQPECLVARTDPVQRCRIEPLCRFSPARAHLQRLHRRDHSRAAQRRQLRLCRRMSLRRGLFIPAAPPRGRPRPRCPWHRDRRARSAPPACPARPLCGTTRRPLPDRARRRRRGTA